jgi:asparagine synthetase B (glutamine-hydrolysing)
VARDDPAPPGRGASEVLLPFWRPSELEIAWGWVPGRCNGVPAVEPGPSELTPAQALEATILPCLLRPPCLVMFSGGRDSSLLLAAACDVARRHHLDSPIAITMRFPAFPDANEDSWQELMIHHVGNPEWVKLTFEDEVDAVGPISRELLLRYGPLWAPSMQMVAAIAVHARGGAVLTGDSGDEIFGRHRAMAPRKVVGRRGRAPSELWAEAARDCAPRSVRRSIKRRAITEDMSAQHWLKPAALEALVDRILADDLTLPLRWDRSIGLLGQRRTWLMHEWNRELLSVEWDTRFGSPFADATFTRALQSAGGRWGYGSRSGLMRANFSGLLPEEIIVRTDKASFNEAVFARHTREFVDTWNGEGLNDDLVDADKLAAHWREEASEIWFSSVMLLKQAWLATRGSGAVLRAERSENHVDAERVHP